MPTDIEEPSLSSTSCPAMTSSAPGLLVSIRSAPGPAIQMFFDGELITAHAHDTILAALLRQGARTGCNEFDNAPRAGFCLMGSCQECSIWDAVGRRLRACMEAVREGLELRSTPCQNVQDNA